MSKNRYMYSESSTEKKKRIKGYSMDLEAWKSLVTFERDRP